MNSLTRESPQEREHRKAERKAANMRVLMTPSRTLHSPIMGGGTSGRAVEKRAKTKATMREQQDHKDKLAGLGCMVCRRLFPHLERGPVELHHLRADGWGKGDFLTLIPLCVEHHRGDTGVHGLGTKGFGKHYGFDQAELLMDALTLVRAA